MSPTVARPSPSQSAHWYDPKTSAPMHTVIAKGTGQPRPTTLRDARELGLVPSVTNLIRSVVRSASLEAWQREQDALALLTTPRGPTEAVDAFTKRVFHEERHQEQEAGQAADLGNRIHKSLAGALSTGSMASTLDCYDYILPVLEYLNPLMVQHCEYCVVGKGYAGTVDLITGQSMMDVWDFKTTRRLPEKGQSWSDHRLQLAAYAEALEVNGFVIRSTWNIYISTAEPGRFTVCENPDWPETYERGFEPILRYWQWVHNYTPK